MHEPRLCIGLSWGQQQWRSLVLATVSLAEQVAACLCLMEIRACPSYYTLVILATHVRLMFLSHLLQMAAYLCLLDIAMGQEYLHNSMNIVHGGGLDSCRRKGCACPCMLEAAPGSYF